MLSIKCTQTVGIYSGPMLLGGAPPDSVSCMVPYDRGYLNIGKYYLQSTNHAKSYRKTGLVLAIFHISGTIPKKRNSTAREIPAVLCGRLLFCLLFIECLCNVGSKVTVGINQWNISILAVPPMRSTILPCKKGVVSLPRHLSLGVHSECCCGSQAPKSAPSSSTVAAMAEAPCSSRNAVLRKP